MRINLSSGRYVEYIDSMGNQFSPAIDARMSTGKGSLGDEKDGKLQLRLLKDAHTSPFEGVVVKLEFQISLVELRELDRHRTTAKMADIDLVEIFSPEESFRKFTSRNEMSGRYMQMPALYMNPVEIRMQSKTNNQGGDGLAPPEVAAEFLQRGKDLTDKARELYDWAIAQGIERGQARMYNTVNQMSRIRITAALKNWCDFLALRLPQGVLEEMRDVAQAVEDILVARFPTPMQQWRQEVYETARVNKTELAFLSGVLLGVDTDSLSSEDKDTMSSIFAKITRVMSQDD